MKPEPIAPHLLARAPDFAARLTYILACLTVLIAHRLPKNRIFAAFLLPLDTYIRRIARRFAAFMARAASVNCQGGRTPRPDPSRGRPGTRKPRLPFPAGLGWLIRAMPNEAALYGYRLEALLAEPDIAELLAALPGAQRILKRIRHALSTEQPRTRRALRPYAPVPGQIPPSPPHRIPPHYFPPPPNLQKPV